jgi:hypothetical protein
LPLVEDRCMRLRCVCPYFARQEVEARFIHENKGPPLATHFDLESELDPNAPAIDLLLIAPDCASDRHLRRLVQLLQEPRYVAIVVRDAELFLDNSGGVAGGPDLAAKT